MSLKHSIALCILFFTPVLAQGAPTESITFNFGQSQQDFSDLTADLGNQGYSNLVPSGKEKVKSLKISYQKPLTSKLVASFSWVDLGGTDIKVTGTIPTGKSNATAAQEIANNIPVRGQGIASGVFFHSALTHRLDVQAGGGLFTYEDTRRATVGSSSASDKSTGNKPFAHIGLRYKLSNKVGVSVEWDHYFLKEDVEHLGIGISYSF